MQVSCHSDTSDKEEEGVQTIYSNGQGRMHLKSVAVRLDDLVEEREHRENGNEHDVVNDRWVAAYGKCNHLADKRDDQKRPEELRRI